MAVRFDRAELRDIKLDHNGYLNATAAVTRAGVFVYRHPDGTVTRELRHPDDVFRPDSVSTLEGRPVTDGHPPEGKVTSANSRHLTCGWPTGKPEVEAPFISMPLQITDKIVIDKAMDDASPSREISCGYTCDVVEQSGTYQGEEYDHRQQNIVYNHIAVVRRGRAGRNVRLQLDRADAVEDGLEDALREDIEETENTVQVPVRESGQFRDGTFRTTDVPGTEGIQMVVARLEDPPEGQRGSAVLQKYIFDKSKGWTLERARAWVERHKRDSEESTTMTVKIKHPEIATATFKQDAMTIEVDENGEAAVATVLARLDAAVAHIKTLEAERDTWQGKLDELKQGQKVDKSVLDAMVRERHDAEMAAEFLKIKDVGKLDTKALKVAIVKAAAPEIKVDEVSEDYIQGRYDMVLERLKEESKNLESYSKLKTAMDGDPQSIFRKNDQEQLSPREKLNRSLQDEWKSDQEKKSA